ncbi:Transmembrane protein 163 [Hondaea fermentalgiana]|uniref:Transmembrane protein 163 n=1 Tax=Hondaea fermentalgiana TaxID=2315210 RepID=A0A2R5GM14_9STRA|nr:Transmembrane protein 163 [Hondaea fermentalgiana]|eukprot:GBG29331.1 Transmembrane protein 163 [Hondaea fermentalgiana]
MLTRSGGSGGESAENGAANDMGELDEVLREAEEDDEDDSDNGPGRHATNVGELRAHGRCGMFTNLCSLQRWRYPTTVEARVLSWLSVALTIITSSVGIGFAVGGHSALMLAYGLEALVDILSSFVILWRFQGATHDDQVHKRREGRAQALIGLSLLATGIIVFIDSCVHLAGKSKTVDETGILVVSVFSFLALSILGLLKAHVGIELKSNALFEDAVAAAGSAMLSLSAIIAISVHEDHPKMWWFDSVIAMFVSICFLLYGAYILHKWKWYRRAFWFPPAYSSRIEGIEAGDEDSHIDLKPLDMDMV